MDDNELLTILNAKRKIPYDKSDLTLALEQSSSSQLWIKHLIERYRFILRLDAGKYKIRVRLNQKYVWISLPAKSLIDHIIKLEISKLARSIIILRTLYRGGHLPYKYCENLMHLNKYLRSRQGMAFIIGSINEHLPARTYHTDLMKRRIRNG